MKPHPRIRKTIMWGGAAVTVLLVVVWIGSASPYMMASTKTGYRFAVRDGNGYMFCWPLAKGDGYSGKWGIMQSYLGFQPLPRWGALGPSWFVLVPLYIPTGLALLATTLAWWNDVMATRAARLNLCPKCYYDRAGIAGDAKCPECGCGGCGGAMPKGAAVGP